MKKTIIASLLAIATLAPAAAFASDGTVSFNGAVASQTCVINGGSPNFTVNLPTVSLSSVAYDGGANYPVAGATYFNINLTGCAADGGARAYFEAGSGVGAGGLLENTGTAKSVMIRLFNTAGGVITPGAASDSQNNGNYIPITNGSATLTYGARYINGDRSVGAGTVIASVTYRIEYQ